MSLRALLSDIEKPGFAALLLALTPSVVACGSNTPELPPELLEANDTNEQVYPAGPYGAEPGDTARNMTFRGLRLPVADRVAEQATNLERIALADYVGKSNYELILVNSAALWCAACQVEHKTLPARFAEREPAGLVILSALYQDAAGDPADEQELIAWTQSFKPNFPMVLDPDYQLGLYASADTAPLNLVIDAKTATILKKYIGDQSEELFAFVDEELARR